MLPTHVQVLAGNQIAWIGQVAVPSDAKAGALGAWPLSHPSVMIASEELAKPVSPTKRPHLQLVT